MKKLFFATVLAVVATVVLVGQPAASASGPAGHPRVDLAASGSSASPDAIAYSSYCHKFPDGYNRCTGTVVWEYFGDGYQVYYESGPSCYTPPDDTLMSSGWYYTDNQQEIVFECNYVSGKEVFLYGYANGSSSGSWEG